MATPYDDEFYAYTDVQAERSARGLLPVVQRLVGPRSVLDIGCGRGGWLRIWSELGAEDIAGVDGDYVDRGRLQIAGDEFRAADLSQSLELGRSFDLVQSLEVAEHVPEAHATTFVGNLTHHGDVVLFSAAPPGQGGTGHVNEQPYEFWRDRFEARGYGLFDAVRAAVAGDRSIEAWYRFNTFLFVNEERAPRLAADLTAHRIAPGAPIPDVAPLPFRVRKQVVRRLPQRVVDGLSRQRMRLATARARLLSRR